MQLDPVGHSEIQGQIKFSGRYLRMLHEVVEATRSARGVGDRAPDFELEGSSGRIRLADYQRSRNVAIFFGSSLN